MPAAACLHCQSARVARSIPRASAMHVMLGDSAHSPALQFSTQPWRCHINVDALLLRVCTHMRLQLTEKFVYSSVTHVDRFISNIALCTLVRYLLIV